jgi:hypothetical protein
MYIGQTVKKGKLNSEAAGKAEFPCEEVMHIPETMSSLMGLARVT